MIKTSPNHIGEATQIGPFSQIGLIFESSHFSIYAVWFYSEWAGISCAVIEAKRVLSTKPLQINTIMN